MTINLTTLENEDKLYVEPQSTQISAQTGAIGSLYGNVGRDGASDFIWQDFRRDLKTEVFVKMLDSVIKNLRENGFLASSNNLAQYCQDNPMASLGNNEFGAKVVTCSDSTGYGAA